MKFDLRKYNDCGKCAMATLLDEFDTEVHAIYVGNALDGTAKKIEINKLEDLFPYLWNIPYIASGKNYYFSGEGTWWSNEYKEFSENDCDDAEYVKDHNEWVKRSINFHNKMMEESKNKLIEANK